MMLAHLLNGEPCIRFPTEDHRSFELGDVQVLFDRWQRAHLRKGLSCDGCLRPR
jgi:hypothetical protein